MNRRKIIALVLFIFMGFFMFAFANPKEDVLKKTKPKDNTGDEIINVNTPNEDIEPLTTIDNNPILPVANNQPDNNFQQPIADTVNNITISIDEDNKYIMEVKSPIPTFKASAVTNLGQKVNVVIRHNINKNKIGMYTVEFIATSDGISEVVKKEFAVVDTTKPVITLIGKQRKVLRLNNLYLEDNAIVEDNYDKDIQNKLVIDSNTNTLNKGIYQVRYNATDSSGNKALEVIRTVHVVDVKQLQEAVIEANDILNDTNNKTLREDFKELINKLSPNSKKGSDIIDNLESLQDEVDEQTKIINDIIDEIYKLRFNVDFVDYNNSYIKQLKVKYKQLVDYPANPIRIGHTFTKWSKKVTYVYDDERIKAQYDINSYQLKINYITPNNISSPENKVINIKYNDNYNVKSPKITGYTPDIDIVKGTMPDHDLDVEVTYSPSTDTKYQVVYYGEGANNNPYQILNAITKTGTTNNEATYEKKDFDGYTYQATNYVSTDITSGNRINPDGSTVVEVYYTRNSYNLNINYGYMDNNEFKTIKTSSASVKHGTLYNILLIDIDGFIKPNKNITHLMPKHDDSINIVYELNKNTKYTINYYFQNIYDDEYTKSSLTEVKYGKTYDKPIIDTTKEFTGFEFKNVSDGVILPDGSGEFNIYYDRLVHTLTINYQPQELNLENTTKLLRYQEEYNITVPPVDGYTPTKNTVSGKMDIYDISETVKYNINIYTVAFNYYLNNKLIHTSKTVTYNQLVPALPTNFDKIVTKNNGKTYQRFTAWKNADTNEEYSNNTRVYKDMTFNAIYGIVESTATNVYQLKPGLPRPINGAPGPNENYIPLTNLSGLKIVDDSGKLAQTILEAEKSSNQEAVLALNNDINNYLAPESIARLNMLNTHNYYYDWYVLKYNTSNGWHLDGQKMKKN